MSQPTPAEGPDRAAEAAQLCGLVEAAQRAAGVIAARQRGDADGVARLMDSFGNAQVMSGGFLLLAS